MSCKFRVFDERFRETEDCGSKSVVGDLCVEHASRASIFAHIAALETENAERKSLLRSYEREAELRRVTIESLSRNLAEAQEKLGEWLDGVGPGTIAHLDLSAATRRLLARMEPRP